MKSRTSSGSAAVDIESAGSSSNDPRHSLRLDSLLPTTDSRLTDRLLTTMGDTSAATAQAARMAARLMARYPEFWPETVRGLLVHSAGWTPEKMETADVGTSAGERTRLLLRRGVRGRPNPRGAFFATREPPSARHRVRARTGSRRRRSRRVVTFRLGWNAARLLTRARQARYTVFLITTKLMSSSGGAKASRSRRRCSQISAAVLPRTASRTSSARSGR